MPTENKVTKEILADRLARANPDKVDNMHQGRLIVSMVLDELLKVIQAGESLEIRGLMTGRVRTRKFRTGTFGPAPEGQVHKSVTRKVYTIRISASVAS